LRCLLATQVRGAQICSDATPGTFVPHIGANASSTCPIGERRQPESFRFNWCSRQPFQLLCSAVAVIVNRESVFPLAQVTSLPTARPLRAPSAKLVSACLRLCCGHPAVPEQLVRLSRRSLQASSARLPASRTASRASRASSRRTKARHRARTATRLFVVLAARPSAPISCVRLGFVSFVIWCCELHWPLACWFMSLLHSA
jgi:hypothetical protein